MPLPAQIMLRRGRQDDGCIKSEVEGGLNQNIADVYQWHQAINAIWQPLGWKGLEGDGVNTHRWNTYSPPRTARWCLSNILLRGLRQGFDVCREVYPIYLSFYCASTKGDAFYIIGAAFR